MKSGSSLKNVPYATVGDKRVEQLGGVGTLAWQHADDQIARAGQTAIDT